ncbi:hypothetical protein BJV82DRAFT_670262 [Fennellomyces sp. T-0311]|nr:hypothetical protein BJV82DRAFT_670262 [Fennellomyces sp. T-0311]
MKWLVLLTVLFAAQATNQDSIQVAEDPITVDLDVFTHHASIHLTTDMDNNFTHISKHLLHQFRQQYRISDDCPSLPLDLPMLKSQVLSAAESLIGDKLSAAWNTFDTKSLMSRHIQTVTVQICPDLNQWCLKENEEAFQNYFDTYIHRHWRTFTQHMREHVPSMFETARLQATQVLDHFFHQCLQIHVDNTTIHWLDDAQPTTPFVFHTS